MKRESRISIAWTWTARAQEGPVAVLNRRRLLAEELREAMPLVLLAHPHTVILLLEEFRSPESRVGRPSLEGGKLLCGPSMSEGPAGSHTLCESVTFSELLFLPQDVSYTQGLLNSAPHALHPFPVEGSPPCRSLKSLWTPCGSCWFCPAHGPVNPLKGHTLVMCVPMPRGVQWVSAFQIEGLGHAEGLGVNRKPAYLSPPLLRITLGMST